MPFQSIEELKDIFNVYYFDRKVNSYTQLYTREIIVPFGIFV